MRLHFQAHGAGRPLIILHGFLGSLDNWQAMNRRFAQSYKAYSVDLRNHGRSPHSGVMNYSVMAQDVRHLIAEEGLDAPYILGHSMGGKVAMRLAALFPEVIEKLVVVDIAPRAYAPAHRTVLHGMRELNLHACKSFAAIGEALSAAIPDAVVRQFIVKNVTRDSDGNFQWRLGLDEIINNYAALTEAILIEKPFTKPAYFIRAERSGFVRDSDLTAIRESFPNSRFTTIASSGHWVHIEAADAFYAATASFLGSEEGSP
jgi:esterase